MTSAEAEQLTAECLRLQRLLDDQLIEMGKQAERIEAKHGYIEALARREVELEKMIDYLLETFIKPEEGIFTFPTGELWQIGEIK